MQDVNDFYNLKRDSNRLLVNEGVIEFDRSKDVIMRYLKKYDLTIFDIGGGDGIYSRWLASLGHNIHLFDSSSYLINQAIELQEKVSPLKRITLANSSSIPSDDYSCDLILLMGPLYHLQCEEDRYRTLRECYRLLKKDGIIIISAISRYGSLLKAINGYGTKYNNLTDPIFQEMIIKEVLTGKHNRPLKYPNFLPTAYYHTPTELKIEVEKSEFTILDLVAVEGPFWQNSYIVDNWQNVKPELSVLVSKLERDIGFLNTSLHIICIGKK